MGARRRDVVVVVVLAAGAIASVAVWHPLGRWVALAVALLTVLAAAAVYRLRPSAFPWRGGVPEQSREHADR